MVFLKSIVLFATVFASLLMKLCNAQCAADWTAFQNNCYKFNLGDGSRDNCASICANIPSSAMLCVENSQQNTFIAGYISSGAGIWLGVEDPAKNYNWIWRTDCVSSYFNWGSGRPNKFFDYVC